LLERVEAAEVDEDRASGERGEEDPGAVTKPG
jgi:hypothetical protein